MPTLIQHPCPTKFAADMVDLVISSDDTIDFLLQTSDGTSILQEKYNPANATIRIGGLPRVINTVLYGQLIEEGGQDHISASFSFLVDGQPIIPDVRLYAAHLQNPLDPSGLFTLLSPSRQDVCHPSFPHPLTFLSTTTATLFALDGTTLNTAQVGSSVSPYTANCDPARLFPNDFQQAASIVYQGGGDRFISHIDHRSYPDATLFIYLNRYDAPETLLARTPLSVKPSTVDDTAIVDGVEQRFFCQPDDEYTASSGALFSPSEYYQWRELVRSRRVAVLQQGQWIPIIVKKASFSHNLKGAALDNVSFQFKLANPRQIL